MLWVDHHTYYLDPPGNSQAQRALSRGPWAWSRSKQGYSIPGFAVAAYGVNPSSAMPLPQATPAPQKPPSPGWLDLAALPLAEPLWPFQAADVAQGFLGQRAWGEWAAVGLGKTCMALSAYWILKERGLVDGMLVIGPESARHGWIGQSSDSITKFNLAGHLVTDGKPLPKEGLVYCSVDKIWRPKYATELLRRVKTGRWVLCADECFPGETLVETESGPVPIGAIVEQQKSVNVFSKNLTTGAIECKPIARYIKKETCNPLYTVTHGRGSFSCTGNHKIWTKEKGYVEAKNLQNETLCLLQNGIPLLVGPLPGEGRPAEILLQSLQERSFRPEKDTQRQGENRSHPDVPMVRARISKYPKNYTLLRPQLRDEGDASNTRSFRKEALERRKLCTNDPAQSHELPRNTRESVKSTAGKAIPQQTWRKWPAALYGTAFCSRSSGWNNRICCWHTEGPTPAVQDTGVLQSGYRHTSLESSNRDRWVLPWGTTGAGKGPTKGSSSAYSRVVCVSHQEARSVTVYNLEIEGNHNYFANGILVSNCHQLSPGSRRFTAVDLWASFCPYRWLLTGTPIANYPDRFYAMWRLLTRNECTYPQWVEWFCKPDGTWHKQRLLWLQDYMKRISRVRTRKEVAPDLPDTVIRTISVPLEGEQRLAYGELLRGAMVGYGGGDRMEWLGTLAKLSSICSHHELQEGDRRPSGRVAKLEVLEGLLEGSGDAQAIIWSWHPGTLDWLARMLPYSSVTYHGGTSQKDRERAIVGFNNGSARLFLGNPSAAGVGLNLPNANIRVFFDSDFSPVDYVQAAGRNERGIKHDPKVEYRLVAQGTVEELAWESQVKKENLRALILGGKQQPEVVGKGILQRWRERG